MADLVSERIKDGESEKQNRPEVLLRHDVGEERLASVVSHNDQKVNMELSFITGGREAARQEANV